MVDSSQRQIGGGVSDWFRRLGSMFGGTMFKGTRDIYATFGYARAPTFDDYLFRYLKQDVAKRIIDAPVRATWGDPPQISSDDAFASAWQNLTAKQPIWHRLMSVDRMAGIGQYAIMIIGIDDGLPLTSPVSPVNATSTGLRNVLYLQPYMQRSLRINEIDNDSASPRFGMPIMYTVTPQGENVVQNLGGGVSNITAGFAQRQAFDVHYTRVLHVADNTLENDIFGASRLESINNLLDDLLKVVGGSAETFWMTGNRGMQIDVDKDMKLAAGDLENLEAELEEYQQNLRRVLRTRGVKVSNLGSDVADPTGNFNVIMSMLSAATGIPQRVLMGSEAGQLASNQDRANWAVRVAERIADFGEPVILVPFIRQLIAMGCLPVPESLGITWPEAFKLSPLERAQTSAQMARSAANLQKMLSDPIGSKEITVTTVTTTTNGVAAEETTTQDGVITNVRVLAQPADTAPGVTAPGYEAQASSTTQTRVEKWIEGGEPMFSLQESRTMVGFGKTMPVFDDKQDSAELGVTPVPDLSPGNPQGI